MQTTIKLAAIFGSIIFALALVVPKGNTQTKVETAGQKFKNIKVLNDMPADQLGRVMNMMSASLGADCNLCHQSNDKDFDVDGNEHKTAAREMLKMTFQINKEFFKGRSEVSCNSCHNGKERPAAVPNVWPAPAVERPKQPDVKPTTDQILDKYALALGGKDNLARVTSRSIKASRVEPDGKTSEPEMIFQKSGKLRVETTYPKYSAVEAFDGKAVWKQGNGENIWMRRDESEQIKREAQLFANPDLKSIYAKLDFRFVDQIDGRRVYLVTATTADNQRERLYFDVTTGLLVRRIATSMTVLGQFPFQVDYADYKAFGGVQLPTTTKFAVPNVRWTRKVTEVKNNVPVDDAKFAAPPAKN